MLLLSPFYRCGNREALRTEIPYSKLASVRTGIQTQAACALNSLSLITMSLSSSLHHLLQILFPSESASDSSAPRGWAAPPCASTGDGTGLGRQAVLLSLKVMPLIPLLR